MAQKNFAQSASWGMCQLEEVPVEGLVPIVGKNITLGRTIFPNFVGGENLTPFS